MHQLSLITINIRVDLSTRFMCTTLFIVWPIFPNREFSQIFPVITSLISSEGIFKERIGGGAQRLVFVKTR